MLTNLTMEGCINATFLALMFIYAYDALSLPGAKHCYAAVDKKGNRTSFLFLRKPIDLQNSKWSKFIPVYFSMFRSIVLVTLLALILVGTVKHDMGFISVGEFSHYLILAFLIFQLKRGLEEQYIFHFIGIQSPKVKKFQEATHYEFKVAEIPSLFTKRFNVSLAIIAFVILFIELFK